MAKINIGMSTAQSVPELAPPPWTPSPQQEAIFRHVEERRGNLIIEARAGTGKTTTLIEVSKRLGNDAIFLAFNKPISVDIGQKLAAAGISGRNVKAATFHSVGFQAWVRHMPKSGRNVRGEKLSILAEKIGMPRVYWAFSRQLVSMAKQHLIGAVEDLPIDDQAAWLDLVEHFDLLDLMPETDDGLDEEEFLEAGLAWSLKLLRQSILESETMIDFDDMIYMPLYSKLRFWQYNTVMIDEAQDTNRARREIAKRLLKPGGMLIAVGDPYQAIYGFTGASAHAMDLIERDFQCKVLPLTKTYRCAEEIVKFAQVWVPDIEPRDNAPPGVVRDMEYVDFLKLVPEPTSAILCRNVKPIVKLAFDYLRRGVGCHIEGREIGTGLISLARRWKGTSTVGELASHLEDYLDREREKLLAQHKEAKFAAVEDKVSTLLVICQSVGYDRHPEAVVQKINQLFKDSDGLAKQVLTLSTIHKSKGREWPTVYILGRRQLMPSPYAKQEWQLEQEENLAYVAVTRAIDELVEVDLPPRR